MRFVRDETGASYVEALIVLLPFLTVSLVLLQLVLALSARVVTQHAAWSAARSALVVLPEGEPALQTGGDELESHLEALGTTSAGAGSADDVRLRTLRADASARLLAISPSAATVRERSVRAAFGGDERGLGGSAEYVRRAVAVTYRDGAATNVTVSYLFYCAVPLADLLLCQSDAALGAVPELQSTAAPWRELTGGGNRFVVIQAHARIPRAGDIPAAPGLRAELTEAP
ncbi:MAG: hypothetical protein AAGF12_07625 [Myxococcota bacterium]